MSVTNIVDKKASREVLLFKFYFYVTLVILLAGAYLLSFSYFPVSAHIENGITYKLTGLFTLALLTIFWLISILLLFVYIIKLLSVIGDDEFIPEKNSTLTLSILFQVSILLFLFLFGHSKLNDELSISGYNTVLKMIDESNATLSHYKSLDNNGTLSVGDLSLLLNTHHRYRDDEEAADAIKQQQLAEELMKKTKEAVIRAKYRDQ